MISHNNDRSGTTPSPLESLSPCSGSACPSQWPCAFAKPLDQARHAHCAGHTIFLLLKDDHIVWILPTTFLWIQHFLLIASDSTGP